MTPMQIMKAAKEVQRDAETTTSISEARAVAVKAATLLFYLAKLHLPKNKQKRAVKAPLSPRKRAAKAKPRRAARPGHHVERTTSEARRK